MEEWEWKLPVKVYFRLLYKYKREMEKIETNYNRNTWFIEIFVVKAFLFVLFFRLIKIDF